MKTTSRKIRLSKKSDIDHVFSLVKVDSITDYSENRTKRAITTRLSEQYRQSSF